ncbi:hypothetical protein EON66_02805, partial [archaeon]
SAIGVPGLMGLDRQLAFTIERELVKLTKGYASTLKAGASDSLLKIVQELQPVTSNFVNTVKLYTSAVKAMRAPLDSLMEHLLVLGQAQLLRLAIGHELRFSCRLESNVLCGAVEALNEAAITDVRKHYYSAEEYPMPDRSFLASVATYCESAGINDPLANIYIMLEQNPFVGMWLSLLCVYQISRFEFDAEFGSLLRRRSAEGVDGGPLAAGIATYLKQLNPSVTSDWLSHMGQFVRSSVVTTVGESSKASTASVPTETINLVLLMQHVARLAHIPDRVLHTFVPSYLFDTIGAV